MNGKVDGADAVGQDGGAHMNADRPLRITWPPPDWAMDRARRPRKARGARKLTLVSVAKQAAKAGIEVARYEIAPDGKIAVIVGEPEPAEAGNPWLAAIETRQ